ncbi:MAG: DNA polymerase III subunit beta [Chloroflexi bacterium]|nr:DNA polymerase III subunit beta [Chloroflexota bacterium]
MRVSVLQENLHKGLSIVNRAVAARPTLPVLANVMLSTEDGRLKLSATNLELGINTWVGAKVEQEGSITIPARLFNDLVSNLSPERVDMEVDERSQTLNLRCGGTVTNIKGIDANEFPLVPEADANMGVAVPAAEFRQMIRQVVFAAARDDNKPVLTGVKTKIEGHALTLSATDGYRLSERRTALEVGSPDALDIIIPARTLEELARVIDDSEEQVLISIPEGRSQVMFHLRDVDVVSSLVDGTFPDYERVIPKDHDTVTTVYSDELLRACKRSEVFAKDNAFTTRLIVNPPEDGMGPGEVRLRSQSNEKGDNESMIDASVDGNSIEISFNIRYLIDLLNVINDDQVILRTKTSADPCLVVPYHLDENSQYIHVIMPMRTN